MHVFEGDFFQSFFGQLAVDLKTGTSVKTIFRLSPQATVFAIDPFKGRLAIYDPGLSILVTQNLPTFGLPLRATAMVDARNIFDFQSSVSGEDGSLRLTGLSAECFAAAYKFDSRISYKEIDCTDFWFIALCFLHSLQLNVCPNSRIIKQKAE